MNPILKKKLEQMYLTNKAEDASKTDRLERWRNLEPESALFISMLIRIQQSKHVLELGTSNGYSTIWLADALESTNGKLTTIDNLKERTRLARENLTRFELDDHVFFLTMDALDFITEANPIYDMIFLDAERNAYTQYWTDLRRLLKKRGSVLLVDNVISHRTEVEGFIEMISSDKTVLLSTLNVGAGILMVTLN